MKKPIQQSAAAILAAVLLTACGNQPNSSAPQNAETTAAETAAAENAENTAETQTETTTAAQTTPAETAAAAPEEDGKAEQFAQLMLDCEQRWMIPAYPEYVPEESLQDWQVRELYFADINMDGVNELIVGGYEIGQMTDHLYSFYVYRPFEDGHIAAYSARIAGDIVPIQLFSDETKLTLVCSPDGSDPHFITRGLTPVLGSSEAVLYIDELRDDALGGEDDIIKTVRVGTRSMFDDRQEAVIAEFGDEAREDMAGDEACMEALKNLRVMKYDYLRIPMDEYNKLSNEEKLDRLTASYKAFRIGEMTDARPCEDVPDVKG